MYQHPIPQNVTSYQFRLIGDMTIKQFFLLGGGIGIAALGWLSGLSTPLKWIIGFLGAGGGFALAFVPIEERPLDHWIMAFIKAIYRPTQFIWQKTPSEPAFFNYTSRPDPLANTPEPISGHQRQANLNTYMNTLPHQATSNQLDQTEQQYLNQLSQHFSISPSQPSPQINTNIAHSPPATITLEQSDPSPNTETKTQDRPPIAKDIAVPKTEDVSLPRSQKLQPPPQEATPLPTSTKKPEYKPSDQSISATTSSSLPFPSAPSTPNTIVGMVLDAQNNIIDNAIVEIRDNQGFPVRATKTNKLGQFFSATPLKEGNYEIEIEKPGFKFDIFKITLENNLVEPLKINARASKP